MSVGFFQIQQRLRLSTKEPAVLEEDFVESEEEQEEYDEFPGNINLNYSTAIMF